MVRISRVVIESHVRNTRRLSIGLCQAHGITLYDLAYDCIADVFEKDGANNLLTLKHFFSSLRQSVDELPSDEVYFAYKAMLLKIAYVQIAHLYAQLDPTGFKIQRNIKETVLKTEMFVTKQNVLGKVLVVAGNYETENLPYVDLIKLLKEFKERSLNKKTSTELLEVLYCWLKQQNEFRKEIKLSDAVYLFKSVFEITDEKSSGETDSFEEMIANNFYETFEIEQITNNVLEKIKTRIFIDYYSRGKLTRQQSEAVYLSIADVVRDWISFGKNHVSFYDYLTKYLQINPEDYHDIIRDKFEYLIKQTRKEFALYLMSKE
ncbi:MAG: hypothetical protein M1495_17165 [Bacteroidetes bacterium]|nr:hypothetical protein [Bacteroidota bacterium]